MHSNKASGRRKGRPTQGSTKPPLYAALDLGTNNCRLLVAEARGQGFRVIDGYSEIVRLGEGLSATGELQDEAVARTLSALASCKAVIDRHGVKRVRAVATQACRAAANGRSFIDRARAETGLDLKVIPAQEEARLAVLGCHDLFDPEARLALVVDIGGGSTELSWVDVSRVCESGLKGIMATPPLISWASFPLGVVTLSEAFRDHGDLESYPLMVDHARDVLWRYRKGRALCDQFTDREDVHLIGTSGTVTSLAGLHLGLKQYNRSAVDGLWLSRTEADTVRDRLKTMPLELRAAEPCIGPQRADLVLSGCAILEAVWSLWPAGRMRVADRGLREGMLLSLIHSKRRNRRRSRKPRRPAQPHTSEGTPNGG